ncbi:MULTISPECIES: N-acetylglucosamine-6-phosphate deacetylase [Thalassospira]|jgi:N-acetylglucosamine-6-phosphate deacetylase|uniref:N-acetylglucosamine-6-phosphate deacetylase n=1 Tax=Thalassospira xiamenensis TaxID=220697 RepID=A0ABR5XYF0_9PROT|nr:MULTISPECIES: N-acetylglucosamine-6-phosphate deacetylase [Thalassospira]MBL4842520.1 N-acetylglucosamine-6-phosphate deacetylase [Thalassospira sp.]MBR9778939.1 N-acetylglucosamine-6-phosphate deacetylase [Rhodospirillales bacterium]KZC97057.1 N-acetylglucosamine-6-phosphate deacetylase [Thalassospira xiamenensis]KZD08073.1 N-acetylglucosamine-6-phosphate deacetylase [Thalassospira xiamenensis]MBR9817631.1 N-acetylglucosamine-6-phosphate deacetylase [Rhodospirillales bacterium]|tara:strand:+ start:10181 stop:11317 length:1137 start_codon:yes stop_codon:yes gene_type:complete
MTDFAITNARVFDGTDFHNGKAVIVRNGKVDAIVESCDITENINVIDAKNQTLAPGLIDVQVNGGGGVLLNDEPNIDGIRAIMAGHRKYGTTAMLPTLITDHRDKMEAAITAVTDAISQDVPGIVGIHLEGPYLNAERKGVHDANIIRPMEDDAIDLLTRLPNGRILVTMAPEKAAKGTIKKLADRGVLVCAGHTAGTYNHVQAAIAEGMRGFTHLFNAMSPMTHREPGVAGAAMADDSTWCGLIADGYHVHPAVLKVAIHAKAKGKIMLVTDAMPTVGADEKRFVLGGEEIMATDGRCALADGTLAGSDLDMIAAVKNCVEMVGIDLGEALRMASLYPAAFLKLDDVMGHIAPGYQADMILFDDDYNVTRSWIKGVE